MESEIIVDQHGGATTVKFSEMSKEELRRRTWVFPEATIEYAKRLLKERSELSK